MFKDKKLLITGGTGSFGNQVLDSFIDTDIGQIIIFSRDENKQDNMRRKYSSNKLKFIVGDVRDYNSLEHALIDVDYVFHAAALKQVPSCEYFPMQAVQTNIVGTENVLNAAIKNKVKNVVVLSTDKAAYPVNAMGISKAMMEKIAIAKAREYKDSITKISITRYGNVLYSRGSVVPLFVNKIINNEPLTITNPIMTRFIMTLKEAMDLVLFAFENSTGGEIFVQKSPACNIGTLASAISKLFNVNENVIEIGLRHGEKMYEVLMTKEEASNAVEYENYYKVNPDFRDLNYEKYLTEGNSNILKFNEYTSDNTNQLCVDQTIYKLLEVPEIKKIYEESVVNRG